MNKLENKCDKCKFCHIEPKEEIEYLKNNNIDKEITMWYQCEITDMPTDTGHCNNCVTFKDKND